MEGFKHMANSDSPDGGQFEVVWPLAPGAPSGNTDIAPRIDLREPSKGSATTRIGFLWDYLFLGDVMFAELEQSLGDQFPHLAFVGHTVFGNIHGEHADEILEALPALLRSHRVDAVISAVGA